jgi:uncharacterized SAM-binding protein YcdF (DUF218 family)
VTIEAGEAHRRSRARAWVGCCLLVIAACTALSYVISAHRQFFLTEAVDLWAVSDPVAVADAVAVFGGGVTTRPFAAAKYYREGLVPKILVSNIPPNVVDGEVAYSETDANRRVLVGHGVPVTAIELLGENLTSTYQETMALRKWAELHHAHRIIVPTEYFSSRRVRWILRHEFAETGIDIEVPALDDPQYPRREWWTDDKAVLNFQNEIIKYAYYRIRY